MTPGQIAYEAYAATTNWKSAVSGAPLPQWDQQAEPISVAWEAAAKAAREFIVPPPPVIPYDEARAYRADELRFSATSRCPCGAGLAYHKDSNEIAAGAWRCAAAMMNTLPSPDPFHGKHAELPFAFYEVRSEDQSRGEHRTTRPTT